MIVPDRPEWIDDITFEESKTVSRKAKGGVLETDRDLAGVLLEVDGRLAVGVADALAEYADSPYSLVQKVRVSGTSKKRRVKETFFELEGSIIRERALHYSGRAPYSTGALAVAQGDKDFRFMLPVWFIPEGIPISIASQYVIPSADYDSLILEVDCGDGLAVLNPDTTTTYTFSAFGSAAGSPRIRVHGIYAQWGSGGRGFEPGLIWKSSKENVSADLAASQQNFRIMNLLTGHLLRSLMVKAGVVSTTTTAKQRAYASLSNTILSELKLNTGTNKLARYFADFLTLREYAAQLARVAATDGYGLLDFCGLGDLSTAFPEPANADADFYLKADVVGAASQAVTLAFDEIRVRPS